MHVDDYQRAAGAAPAAASTGRKGEKLNVQQLLADPTSMQVLIICPQAQFVYSETWQ